MNAGLRNEIPDLKKKCLTKEKICAMERDNIQRISHQLQDANTKIKNKKK